jgi:hypothetical protein
MATGEPNDEAPEPGLINVPDPDEDTPPWLGLAQYHSNETLAMLQRYDQIQNLIGAGHHALSEGNFCEDLVRAFLRETLPKRFSVDTGFVLGNRINVPWRSGNPAAMHWKLTTASPQLDVIVHDTDNFAPVLRTGEFVVVLPDAVRGVIEVKKNLTSGQLKTALLNLAVTRHLVNQWRGLGTIPLFTAIFTFGRMRT